MSCIVHQKQLVKCVTFYVYSWLLNNHFIMHTDMLRDLDLMSINISLLLFIYFLWIFNKQRWRKLKLLNLKMETKNPFRIQISNFEWMKNYANLSAICRLLFLNSKCEIFSAPLSSAIQFSIFWWKEKSSWKFFYMRKKKKNKKYPCAVEFITKKIEWWVNKKNSEAEKLYL